MDAGLEISPIRFDFGPWIPDGVTITSVGSVTCVVVSGVDASASSRVIGMPAIVTSETTGRASAQVNQFFGMMVDGVVYRLTVLAIFSDGSQEPLWVHAPAKSPN
jgi:hypothetical protein